jgi:hypothetical protein
VFGMAETDLVSFGGDRQALIFALPMANIAGREIASPFLSSGAVALIARRVRAVPSGYRQRDAPIDGLVTRNTSGAGVLRVIELHVEAFQT